MAGRAVVVMALYGALAVFAYLHSWAHPQSVSLAGGTGDAAQTMWYLRWVPWAIGHGHNPLISTQANYPFGVNLVDQTSVLALGLVLAPVTLLWGAVVSFTLAMTLALALSAGAGYLLCARFVSWRPAAFAGGLLYGFSPYMVGQGLSHLNLVFVPLPPLMLLVLHDLVVRRRRAPWRDGVRLAALVVAQFFISTEILATTALFGLLAVIVVAVAWWREVPSRLRPVAAGIGVTAVVAGAVLAFPVYELLAGPQHITGSVIGFRYYYSALLAPLLPPPLLRFGTAHLKALGARIGGNGVENGTYLGAPLLLLAAVTTLLVRRPGRRGVVRVAAVMAVIAFVLSLGDHFHVGLARYSHVGANVLLPGNLIYKVPLLNQAFPVRYSLYVAMFVSVILACGLDAVHDSLSGRFNYVAAPAAVVLAAAALVPLVPAWPYPSQTGVGVPPYFLSSGASRIPAGAVALVYPYANASDSQPQLWQAEAGLRFKMPGGYFLVPAPGGGSATSTPTLAQTTLTGVFAGPPPARTPALRARLRSEMASWRVGTVVAQPVGHDPVGFFTWLTGRPPDARQGGMVEWYHTTWAGP